MRYRLLGAMEARTDDGLPLTITTPKRRALLAVLLLHANRPISAPRLAEALWGSDGPPAAIDSLHAHLSRLRRELRGETIETTPAGYVLHLAPGDLDIAVFEEHLEAARHAIIDERWLSASIELREALTLWRGPALDEFRHQPFAQPEILRLEQLRRTAIEDRTEMDLALGRHATVIGELEAVVGEDPLRERAWGQLMIALYRSGRQADALAAYRRHRRHLIDELGIDPSPELQQLEVRILRQDPALDGPVDHGQRPVRLPAPETTLVGRHEELDRVVRILHECRLLTLTGPGGVGKTRLALLAARALVAAHPDGVLFVDLSAIRDPSAVMARIGEETGGGERPAEVIGTRRMLLVLDNFEQVIDAAPEVTRLLGRCPGLRVLVTSRAPLRVTGEHQFAVPPLSPSDGMRLFVARAESAMATSIAADDVVGEIVAALDGLPLALELAAARARMLAPRDLRDRLAGGLRLLQGGPRDAPQRHRTLEATIAWSYDLLDPVVQAVFRRLSVLAPGFDLPATLAVGEADLDAVGELVDQSLLSRVADRYAMLETVREFASSRAAEREEVEPARDRLLAHYRHLPLVARRDVGGGLRHRAWIDLCTAERQNLRLAFERALEIDDREAILQLFRGVGMYWLLVGAIDEGWRWAQLAIAASRDLRPGDRLQPLLAGSEFPRYGGDLHVALDLKLRALEIARQADARDEVATVLDDIGWIHAALDDDEQARACIEEALAVHERETGCAPLHRAHTLCTAAEIALRAGRIQQAVGLLEEIAELEARGERWPDWDVEIEVLRGHTMHAAGRDEQAMAAYLRAVRAASELGFQRPASDALDGLASIACHDDARQAARLMGMADRLRAEARARAWLPRQRAAAEAIVTARLGADLVAALRSEGHALSLTAMAAEVLDSRARPQSGHAAARQRSADADRLQAGTVESRH